MEASENSSLTETFDKMFIDEKSKHSNKEVQLYLKSSNSAYRHPYVFCKICGKFGRKDHLTKTHFEHHAYLPTSKMGFVLFNQEPTRDKYDDFEQFKAYYGIQNLSQESYIEPEVEQRQNQLECQRFFWGSGKKSTPKMNLKDIKQIRKLYQHKMPSQDLPTTSQLIQKNSQSYSALQKAAPASQKRQKIDVQSSKNSSGRKQIKCAKTAKDMRNKCQKKQLNLKVIKNQRKTMKTRKSPSKQLKTLVIGSLPKPKRCSGELKNLSWQTPINKSSKRIKKSKLKVKVKPSQKNISLKATVGSQKPESIYYRSRSDESWKILVLKLKLNQRNEKQREINKYFKDFQSKAIQEHSKEVLQLNEQHKQLMLRERGKHCHLYNQSANFESTQQQLNNCQETISAQRDEINYQLRRLARYAPVEVKDYPKNLITNGNYDPVIWKLTREAAADETAFKELQTQHKANKIKLEQVQKENQDYKNQILYASNHLKMINQAGSLAIKNLFFFQQSNLACNGQSSIQNQSLNDSSVQQIPINSQQSQEFQYCFEESVHEEVQNSNEVSSSNKNSQKSVSFNQSETIIGKKLMNSKQPRYCSEVIPRQLAKSKSLKQMRKERLQMQNRQNSQASNIVKTPDSSENLDQTVQRSHESSGEFIFKEDE